MGIGVIVWLGIGVWIVIVMEVEKDWDGDWDCVVLGLEHLGGKIIGVKIFWRYGS